MDGAVVHNMLLPLGSAELFLEDLVVINTAEQRGQVNSACGGSAPPGTALCGKVTSHVSSSPR